MAVFKQIIAQYEVMEPILQDDYSSRISASFTPSNGIRINIEDCNSVSDEYINEVSFDLEMEDAIALGEALIRWAKAGH